MTDAFISLLGETYTSAALRQFLKDEDLFPEKNTIEGHTYFNFKESGLSLVFDEGDRLVAAQLYSAGRDGYSQYSRSLPEELKFSMSSNEVETAIGKPMKAGGGKETPGLGMIPLWNLFVLDAYALHLEYSSDKKSIGLISLMSLDALPLELD